MSKEREPEKIYLIVNEYTGEAIASYHSEEAAMRRYIKLINQLKPVRLEYTRR